MCEKSYVGKTIVPLSLRANIHRAKFFKCIRHSGKLKPQHMREDDHGQQIIYTDHGMHHKDTKKASLTVS